MCNLLNRFKRGQVWIIYQNTQEAYKKMTNDNHLFEKTRPWVIIQSNECIDAGDPLETITCAPLSKTIREQANRTEVKIESSHESMAYCDKIRTFNKSDFETAKFIGFLSDEDMEKVDEALAIHLGLKMKYPGLDELELIIEKIAEAKIAAAKVNKVEMNSTTAAIKHITTVLTNTFEQQLKDTNDTVVSSEPEKEEPKTLTYYVKDNNNLEQDIVKTIDTDGNIITIEEEKGGKPKTTKKSKAQNRWTVPKMKRFLNDAETMSVLELGKKYKIGSSTIYLYKNKFRTLLNYDVSEQKVEAK